MSKISVNDPEQYEKFFCTARIDGISTLGGKVDMRSFTNLKEFEISNHGITELKNYHAEQLEIFRVFNNNIQDELKPFGENVREIKIFNDNDTPLFGGGIARRDPSNSFTGDLREIIAKCKDSLVYFDAHSEVATKNNLSGLLPNLSEYKKLRSFKVGGNKNIVGTLNNLSGLTNLIQIDISETSISNISGDFDIPDFAKMTEYRQPSPKGFRHFKLYDTPMSSSTLDRIVDKIYAKAGTAYSGNFKADQLSYYADFLNNATSSVEIGPAHLISDASFTKLGTMRGNYKMKVDIHVDDSHLLLDNPFASDAKLAVSMKKLKATSSKAMKIRRGVDDVTAVVHYDNSGNISSTSSIDSASNGKTYANASEFLNEVIFLNSRITTGPRRGGTSDSVYDKLVASGTDAFTTSTNADGTFKIFAKAASNAGTINGRVMLGLDTPILEKDSYRTRFRFTGNVLGVTGTIVINGKSGALGSASGSYAMTQTSPTMTLAHNTAKVNYAGGAVNNQISNGQPTGLNTDVYIDTVTYGIIEGTEQKFYVGMRVTSSSIALSSNCRVTYIDNATNPTRVIISGNHGNLADNELLTFSHGFDVNDLIYKGDTQVGARVTAVNVSSNIHQIRYNMGDAELEGLEFLVGNQLKGPAKFAGTSTLATTQAVISALGGYYASYSISSTGAIGGTTGYAERYGRNETTNPDEAILNTDLTAFNFILGVASGTQDELNIDNFKIEAVKHSATVVEWYDQSGSGLNPTQTDKTLQPEIAHDGAFLSGVSFGLAKLGTSGTGTITCSEVSSSSTTLKLDNISSGFTIKIGMGISTNNSSSTIPAGTVISNITSQTSTAATVVLDQAASVADNAIINISHGIFDGHSHLDVPGTDGTQVVYDIDNTGEYSLLTVLQTLKSNADANDGGFIAGNANAAAEGSGLFLSSSDVFASNGSGNTNITARTGVLPNNDSYNLVGLYYKNKDVTITKNGDDGSVGETLNQTGYNFASPNTTNTTDTTFRIGSRNARPTESDAVDMKMKIKELVVFNKDKGTRTTSGLKYNQAIEPTIMRAHGITSEA